MMCGQIDTSEIERTDEPQRRELKSLLGVPITPSSEVVGLLELPHPPHDTSREADDRQGLLAAIARVALECLNADAVQLFPKLVESRRRLEEEARSLKVLHKRIFDAHSDISLPDAAEEAINASVTASQTSKLRMLLSEGMLSKRYKLTRWVRAASALSDVYRDGLVGKVDSANRPEQEKLTEQGPDIAIWIRLTGVPYVTGSVIGGRAINVVQSGREHWPLRFTAAALDVDLLYQRQVSPADVFTLAYTQLARVFAQQTLGTSDRDFRERSSELLAPGSSQQGLDVVRATSELTWTYAWDVVVRHHQPVQQRDDAWWDLLRSARGPSQRNTTWQPVPSETELDAIVEGCVGSYERHTCINQVADVDWAVFFNVGLCAERRERCRDKRSFFLGYRQAITHIADDPASYISVCRMLKWWRGSFSPDDMLDNRLGCRGQPMRPGCGKRYFFGVSLMPTASASTVADAPDGNHCGISIAIVEADPALTTVDGYAVTTGVQGVIRLRASLSEDDRARGKQTLLSRLRGHRKPGVFFWHAEVQPDDHGSEGSSNTWQVS